jgi:enoyl-CoA hydratase
MADEVSVRREGKTLIVEIDRPQVRNALNRAAGEMIAAAMDELDADPDLVSGILTGAGGTFCAGMDLKAFLQDGRPEIAGRGLAGITETPPRKPLIAAVEGYALAGGCEIALACDLIVAGESASFGIPEVRRGLVAGSGGLIRLPRRIPPQIAMEYALTGAHMTAPDAHRWGLVNRLVPEGGALTEARSLAAEIAQNAPLAVQLSKRIIVESQGWPTDEIWARQNPLVDEVLDSADAKEGARAFAEKRAPIWEGA